MPHSGRPPGRIFRAFANVYRAAFDGIVKRASGEKFESRDTVYPNVYDGVEGMYFIQQCVASSARTGRGCRSSIRWRDGKISGGSCLPFPAMQPCRRNGGHSPPHEETSQPLSPLFRLFGITGFFRTAFTRA